MCISWGREVGNVKRRIGKGELEVDRGGKKGGKEESLGEKRVETQRVGRWVGS